MYEHLSSVHKIRTGSAVPGSLPRVKGAATVWKGNWCKYPEKRERNPNPEAPIERAKNLGILWKQIPRLGFIASCYLRGGLEAQLRGRVVTEKRKRQWVCG